MRPDDPALGPTRITVGCANFEAVPRDKRATLEKMDGVIAHAAGEGCDLVIFPELALNTWGPCPDCADAHQPCEWHRDQAERADGPACRAVVDMADAHGVHVIYGFEENDGDRIFNAANVVAPDGLVTNSERPCSSPSSAYSKRDLGAIDRANRGAPRA